MSPLPGTVTTMVPPLKSVTISVAGALPVVESPDPLVSWPDAAPDSGALTGVSSRRQADRLPVRAAASSMAVTARRARMDCFIGLSSFLYWNRISLV